MLPGTAGEKLRHIIDKFMDLRKTEENKIIQDPNVWQGDLTTVNMTVVEVILAIFIRYIFLL